MNSQAIRQFNAKQLEREIRSLPRAQRIAFLLSIAERFYPYYLKFHQQAGWGDPLLLRSALDAAWSILAGESARADLRQLGETILKVCPDTERFEGPNVSTSLAACSTTVYLLWFIESGADENVVQAAQAAADAIDGYVGWLLFPNHVGEDTQEMWQRRAEHDLMQNELKRQEEDLLLLRKRELSDASTLAELRARWTASS